MIRDHSVFPAIPDQEWFSVFSLNSVPDFFGQPQDWPEVVFEKTLMNLGELLCLCPLLPTLFSVTLVTECFHGHGGGACCSSA